MSTKHAAKTKHHESAAGHVSGSAVYTDDLRKLDGLLTLWPLLSPHARARITGLDTEAAHAIPGVVTVLEAADVPGENDSSGHANDEILLPTDEVFFWGQAVVWIVAEKRRSRAARSGGGSGRVQSPKTHPQHRRSDCTRQLQQPGPNHPPRRPRTRPRERAAQAQRRTVHERPRPFLLRNASDLGRP